MPCHITDDGPQEPDDVVYVWFDEIDPDEAYDQQRQEEIDERRD